ncbi:unnamed protein product, partial [Prorocentrum cordatum]
RLGTSLPSPFSGPPPVGRSGLLGRDAHGLGSLPGRLPARAELPSPARGRRGGPWRPRRPEPGQHRPGERAGLEGPRERGARPLVQGGAHGLGRRGGGGACALGLAVPRAAAAEHVPRGVELAPAQVRVRSPGRPGRPAAPRRAAGRRPAAPARLPAAAVPGAARARPAGRLLREPPRLLAHGHPRGGPRQLHRPVEPEDQLRVQAVRAAPRGRRRLGEVGGPRRPPPRRGDAERRGEDLGRVPQAGGAQHGQAPRPRGRACLEREHPLHGRQGRPGPALGPAGPSARRAAAGGPPAGGVRAAVVPRVAAARVGRQRGRRVRVEPPSRGAGVEASGAPGGRPGHRLVAPREGAPRVRGRQLGQVHPHVEHAERSRALVYRHGLAGVQPALVGGRGRAAELPRLLGQRDRPLEAEGHVEAGGAVGPPPPGRAACPCARRGDARHRHGRRDAPLLAPVPWPRAAEEREVVEHDVLPSSHDSL